MNRGFLALVTLALAATLGACAERPPETLGADFGNAVNSNIAAQVDNPMPNEKIGVGPQDGARADGAIERYRADKVFHPQLPLEGGHIYDQPPQMQQQ